MPRRRARTWQPLFTATREVRDDVGHAQVLTYFVSKPAMHRLDCPGPDCRGHVQVFDRASVWVCPWCKRVNGGVKDYA